jgi:hypothetical protein
MRRRGLGVLIVGLALLVPAASSAAHPASIGRANLDGSGANQIFITANEQGANSLTPGSLAADADHLYWVSASDTIPPGDAIARANLDGTAVDRSFIDIGPYIVGGLAVGADHIYWTGSSTIGFANLDGTGMTHVLVNNLVGANGLALDSNHMYWTNYSDDTIGRANLDGAEVHKRFISGSGDVSGGVAVDSNYIYWAHATYDGHGDQIQGSWIGRATLDGTQVDQHFIKTNITESSELAVDSRHIYWADLTNAKVGRAKLDGSRVHEDLEPGAFASGGVAVESNHVYWGNWPRPSMKIGKPKQHKDRGIGRLPVRVFGPGKLVLEGKGLRTDTKSVASANRYRLALKPTGAKKRKLRRHGSVHVTANVTFTLTGAHPRTKSKSVRLVKR